MKLIRLAWSNILDTSFRSWVVFLCAALVAGFAVSGTIVIGGAQESLHRALARLGADILVVPQGVETRVQHALLMGVPVKSWMPRANLERISAITGVDFASPQLYLATLRGATCCSVPDMFLIAYEPETDFTLRPWLDAHLHEGLKLGQVLGGYYVYLPADQEYIQIYGYDVDLRANLDATGTGLDQSMFMTFETAKDIARLSPEQAVQPLNIPDDSVSAVLVKVQNGEEPSAVVDRIRQTVPGVTPIENSRLFQLQRQQMTALFRSVVVLMSLTWLLSLLVIGLVTTMVVNARRQQIGVMRALGSTRNSVLISLLAEGALLALAGGVTGVVFASFGIYLFRNRIISTLGYPFLFPAPLTLLGLLIAGLGLALLSVLVAALIPALRMSRKEPALAMRE